MAAAKRTTSPEAQERAAAEAALRLAGREGWRRVRLEAVAEEADLTLGALRTLARDKTDLLILFLKQVDAEVLAEDAGFRAEDSVRDRLFDLLMRRLDGLEPFKPGVQSSVEETLRDPLALLALGPADLRALSWYLEAAGVSADGPLGALRVKGLAAIWLATLRTWFGDESPDLSKTMKTLDQGLARAEAAAGWIAGRGSRGRPAAADAEDGASPQPEDEAGDEAGDEARGKSGGGIEGERSARDDPGGR